MISESYRLALLSKEYLQLDTLERTLSKYLSNKTKRSAEIMSSIHYFVKLGYTVSDILEFSPVDLNMFSIQIQEIESELNRAKELAYNSNGLSGDASID